MPLRSRIASPTIVDVSTSTTTQTPRDQWTEEDRRKIHYDLKAKNIITSALGINEYFKVSNCSNAKEICDTLQLTHEGTTDVKRSRGNTLHMNMNYLG